MLSVRNINPLVRAIGVFSAVAVLVTSATLAVFTTNTVALEDNSLLVNSDVLRISNGGEFTSPSVTGFAFNNVALGTESTPQAFYLQNLSNVDLTLSVGLADAPVYQNVDAEDVTVKIYDQNGALVLSSTLAQLDAADQVMTGQLDALATGNGDPAANEGDFTYTVTVAQADGNPAEVTNIDLAFTGTAPEDE